VAGMLIGYACTSTEEQDLTAQRDGLQQLGVELSRIYVDHGLSCEQLIVRHGRPYDVHVKQTRRPARRSGPACLVKAASHVDSDAGRADRLWPGC
jgi:hypothetical protein